MKPHMIHAIQQQQIVRIIVLMVAVDVMNMKSIPKTLLQPLSRSMRVDLKPCQVMWFAYQNSGSRS